MVEDPVAAKLALYYRSQEYTHEHSFGGDTYVQQYRKKDIENIEDISEIFHENTKLNRSIVKEGTENIQALGNDLSKIEEKINPDFTGKTRIDLSAPSELNADFKTVLNSRRSAVSFGEGSFNIEKLSQCLYYAAGESTSRTYPSPGKLYPSELFFASINIEGLKPGIYYYNSNGHYLRKLQGFSDKKELTNKIHDSVYQDSIVPDLDRACVLFLICAEFWHAKFKYGPRGYRYVLQESGHMAQNILLTLTAIDLASRPLAAFYDRKMNSLLGFDGVNSAILYMVAAGNKNKNENPHDR